MAPSSPVTANLTGLKVSFSFPHPFCPALSWPQRNSLITNNIRHQNSKANSQRSGVLRLLYIRDELGVARGTFEPMVAGLKFFYLYTLGYDWPLFTKKKSASRGRSGCPTSAPTPTAAA